MEITNQLHQRWQYVRQLGRARQLAVGLVVLLIAAICFSAVLYLRRPPLIAQGDFAPFASRQEYDTFTKKHPAMLKQAPTRAHFHFKTSVSPQKQLVVQIYLLQLAVKADDSGKSQADYVASLKQFQQEAKSWFKQQGEDLSQDYVQWIPNPDGFGPTPSPTPHAPIGG